MSDVWINMEKEKIPSSLEFNESFLSRIPPDSRILDIGCGNGDLCKMLSEKAFEIYGIDCSHEAIDNAKKLDKKSKYFTMDASELSFEQDYFDLVIVKAVFTVITDASVRTKIMSEIYRVLKNNGLIYIADFAQTWWNYTYYKRYIDNYPITGEYGLFNALNQKGEVEYIAKHFAQKEIVDLYSTVSVNTIVFDTIKVKTRSGNIIDGYKIILQKNLKERCKNECV
jgi:ubiquinone/menaquinone biosynthesis C-methylase UbiE